MEKLAFYIIFIMSLFIWIFMNVRFGCTGKVAFFVGILLFVKEFSYISNAINLIASYLNP